MTQRFRLFPVVIVTAFVVFAMKMIELVRHEEVMIASISVAQAQEKTAGKKAEKEKEAKPEKAESGSKDTEKAKMKKADKKDEKKADGKKESKKEAPVEQLVTSLSQSEIALLESLSKRRKQLDKREKDLDLRIQLLKAAEKRIDEKIKKLEEIKGEIELRTAQEKQLKNDKFKKLVSIYEGMKPKEAARIFSQLNGKVVLQVAERMAPRKLSAILAKMQAKAAERLTIELANKASGENDDFKELPQIGSDKSG